MPPEMIDIDCPSARRAKLYIDLLQSVALEDSSSLQDVISNISLGSVMNLELHDSESTMLPAVVDSHGTTNILTKEDMLRYGSPSRHLLNGTTQQLLLTELHTDEGRPPSDTVMAMAQSLPEAIRLTKDQIESLNQEVKVLSYDLINLMAEAADKSKELDNELCRATSLVFPHYHAARTASIDLLAAGIEASLIKLSLTKERSERSIYNYQSGPNRTAERNTVTHAIERAFRALKDDENEMDAEIRSLDSQLAEYETLLNLVDGGHGGYQQVIDDWTKIKQDTDECLKDLRRLGWTEDTCITFSK
ncbi:hypothetical protein JR316_0008070 [Psilocybe cubensis]|uniref:Uncharacterized protein n=2 Tax=Psilocybe cubensis TaxID=181762 RepID=A0ACB8GV77_PSICU|nr:hypothetical protein JR316_0008070 [Psilocybe cubensis]KAH9479476.1 hypothetical protein JR316_0008070 [Psilocybe cubensis]